MDNEIVISLDESFEKSPSKQPSIEPMSNTIRRSSITQFKLKPLFDALNKNFFNGRFQLNGDIKWTDYLKSRTAAVLFASTSTGGAKQFFRVSKTLLKKCTRKQLIESLMYEMIFAYVKKYLGDIDRHSDQFQSVLKHAMDYVNATSGMELFFNYSFTAHNTIEAFSQWIDIDDGGLSVLDNNNTIICISDDESDESDEFDEPNQLVDVRRNDCTEIRMVSNKINLSDSSNCLSIQCYAPITFYLCFRDTNFRSISNVYYDSTECPLCCKLIDRKALNFHFMDCDLFST